MKRLDCCRRGTTCQQQQLQLLLFLDVTMPLHGSCCAVQGTASRSCVGWAESYRHLAHQEADARLSVGALVLQVMLMEVCDKLREQEHLGVEYPQDACKPETVEGYDL